MKPYVFYLRNKHKHPVACVASIQDGGTVHFAIATHNPMDVFSRKTGRNIATGRLRSKNEYIAVNAIEGIPPKKRVLLAINDSGLTPSRTKVAAKRALKDIERAERAAAVEAILRVESESAVVSSEVA